MRLYGLVFPDLKDSEKQGLYYNGQGSVEPAAGQVVLGKGETITFNTYFNGFPGEKYRRYTRLERLAVSLRFGGKLRVRCYAVDEALSPKIVAEQVLESPTMQTTQVWWPELSWLEGSLLLYFSLEALEDSRAREIQYWGKGERTLPRLALVTCTFHREQEVIHNHTALWEKLWNTDLWQRLTFFIVDNGQSLCREDFPPGDFFLFPNPNHGGSGGFARGMQEVRRAGGFSHMVLMDDDIAWEPGSLERLDAFLSLLRPEYETLCIGGGMLYQDAPCRQFEAGGKIEGLTQRGYGHYLDLSLPQNVAENERDHFIDYNGWWLMCLSLKAVGEELPRPFFIKYDDVDFCLRCRLPIITLNGFGVWHELFEKKYTTVMEYYQTRNFCFTFGGRVSPRELADHIQAQVLGKLYRHQYNAAKMMVWGYEDYRKGEKYLYSLDPEALHRRLLAEAQPFFTDRQLWEQYGVAFHPDSFRWGHEEKPLKPLQKLTGNGHLIPRWLYPKEPRGYRITHVVYDTQEMYFGADKVLHYNPFTHTGYVSRISQKEFWKIRYRLLKSRRKL